MTLTELQDLSPDELRVRVAELMGWYVEDELWWHEKCRTPLLEDMLPDYDESLDACREFEDAMTRGEWDIYIQELENVTRKQGDEVFPKWREVDPCRVRDVLLIRATPLQKCQAYILTKQPQ